MALPSGYTQLGYIESTGTQWIDTGVKANQNTRIDADYYTTAAVGAIVGADTSWGSNMCTIEVHFAAFATSNYNYSSVPSDRHSVSLNKGTLSLDGTTLSTMGGTFTTPVNLTMFALNRNGAVQEYGSIRLYSCQIYDNNTMVRNFIPCSNGSGEVGLWDDVNSVFYGNAGSGVFTAGPEIVGVSKVQLKDLTVLVDLTGDDVTAETVLQGVKFHDSMGRNLIGRLIQKEGMKAASGTVTPSGNAVTVSGLGFTPTYVILISTSKYPYNVNQNNYIKLAVKVPNLSSLYGYTYSFLLSTSSESYNALSTAVTFSAASGSFTITGNYNYGYNFNGEYNWYAIG